MAEIRLNVALVWTIAVAAIGVLSSAVGAWWTLNEQYLLDTSWYADDEQWNADILRRQEAIEFELLELKGQMDQILTIERSRQVRSEALIDRLEILRRDLEYQLLIAQDRHP